MSNPISIFPIFVRDQVYPATGVAPGRVVDGLDVTLDESPSTVTIDEGAFVVTVTPLVIVAEGEG